MGKHNSDSIQINSIEVYDYECSSSADLDKIVQAVYMNPYSTFYRISRLLHVKMDIVKYAVESCERLFHVRKFDKQYVSLSPEGYMYASRIYKEKKQRKGIYGYEQNRK